MNGMINKILEWMRNGRPARADKWVMAHGFMGTQEKKETDFLESSVVDWYQVKVTHRIPRAMWAWDY
jgi:hypothetical protein